MRKDGTIEVVCGKILAEFSVFAAKVNGAGYYRPFVGEDKTPEAYENGVDVLRKAWRKQEANLPEWNFSTMDVMRSLFDRMPASWPVYHRILLSGSIIRYMQILD